MTLRIEWPIENPDRTIEDIKAEARESLMLTLATNGLRATGKPSWHLQHGEHPSLIAEVGVVELPAVATEVA